MSAPEEHPAPPGRGADRDGSDAVRGTAGALVLAIVVGVLLAAFAGVAAFSDPAPDELIAEEVDDELQGCETGNWPREAFGRPQALTDVPPAGVYVWLDFEGWHVRSAGLPVSGQVFVTGQSIVPSQGGPAVDVQPNSLTFELDGTDASTGLDFTVGCDFYVITFDVQAPSGPVGTDQIHLGGRSAPGANPFILQRERPQ